MNVKQYLMNSPYNSSNLLSRNLQERLRKATENLRLIINRAVLCSLTQLYYMNFYGNMAKCFGF